MLYLADEYPQHGLKAPAPRQVSVSLMLYVPTPTRRCSGHTSAVPPSSVRSTRTTEPATRPLSIRLVTAEC